MIKALRKLLLDVDFRDPTKTAHKDRQHAGRRVPVSYRGSLRPDGDPGAGSPASQPAPESAVPGGAGGEGAAPTLGGPHFPRLDHTQWRTTPERQHYCTENTWRGAGYPTVCKTAI